MKAEKKFKALLDRIEGDKGMVLLGEEEREAVDFPKDFLPEGAKEGDILSFKIRLESRRTKEAKAKVAEMIKKLSTS
ncbi:DUF3006 domain-containing protein [Candidatus Saganbacteria bacterium]|nr:DUF3006 domain-containing protein [Candidatus Saganbacteria bacterium]